MNLANGFGTPQSKGGQLVHYHEPNDIVIMYEREEARYCALREDCPEVTGFGTTPVEALENLLAAISEGKDKTR